MVSVMDYLNVYEIIGYVASVLVAVSLMMTSILKLRVINLVGSACFTAYGLLIGAYPVAVVNFIIVIINCYYLYEASRTREYFKLLKVQPDSEYLRYFLNFNEAEIKKFVPDFSYEPAARPEVLFVLRDLVPAGLIVAEPLAPASLLINLDFVIPGYRDFKIGRYVFCERKDFFRERGVEKVYSRSGTRAHQDYLRSMGFVPDAANGGRTYSLSLV